MTALTVPNEIRQQFPQIAEGILKAKQAFESIKSFQDIERLFLKGAGLSSNSYRSYLESVRQFYNFTNGKHPLQATAGDVEAFYDDMIVRIDISSARLRIAGLKRFFQGVEKLVPLFSSPFNSMEKRLVKKLSKTRKGNRQRGALTPDELRALLEWLRQDTSIKGREDYAMIYMLATSGLRSAELLQLTWGKVQHIGDTWKAYFTGKGGTNAEQELYEPAVEAVRDYFQHHFNREPQPGDALFWGMLRYNGDTSRPIKYITLYRRVEEIGERARAAGIIKRDLRFSPHMLRRTYATVLYASGMGLKAIKNKTRHSSIETLVKHYVVDDTPASAALNKIFDARI